MISLWRGISEGLKVHNCGEKYFQALGKAISEAKKQILIGGFALDVTAKLFPSQPGGENNVMPLQEIVPENVKVRIATWNAAKVTFQSTGIQDWKTKNKQVEHIEHGDVLTVAAIHMKYVIVDDTVAFLGGIDILPTRNDDCTHHRVPFSEDRRGMALWRDVQLEVHQSCVVDQLIRVYREMWNNTIDKNQRTGHALRNWFNWKIHDLFKGAPARPAEEAQGAIPHPQQECSMEVMLNGYWTRLGHVLTRERRSGCQSNSRRVRKNSDDCRSDYLEKYQEMIQGAETFLYIENQYFIGNWMELEAGSYLGKRIAGYENNPKNMIPKLVIDRVVQKPELKVAMTLALCDEATNFPAIWQTINMFHHAIAKKQIGDRLGLFFVGSIVKCGETVHRGDAACFSVVYTHTKAMLSEGSAIVGSANINDRSLLADYLADAEIGLYTQDISNVQKIKEVIPEYQNDSNVLEKMTSKANHNADTLTKLSQSDIRYDSIFDFVQSAVNNGILHLKEENAGGIAAVAETCTGNAQQLELCQWKQVYTFLSGEGYIKFNLESHATDQWNEIHGSVFPWTAALLPSDKTPVVGWTDDFLAKKTALTH